MLIWERLQFCFWRIVLLAIDFLVESFFLAVWICHPMAFGFHGFWRKISCQSYWGSLSCDEMLLSCCFQDSSNWGRYWLFCLQIFFLPPPPWLFVGLPFCICNSLDRAPHVLEAQSIFLIILFLSVPQTHNLNWPIFKFTDFFLLPLQISCEFFILFIVLFTSRISIWFFISLMIFLFGKTSFL